MPDWLRERLLREPPSLAEGGAVRGDLGTSAAVAAEREAAVLVPIVTHEAGPSILFTRRTEHLPDHPGQVSFPGGSVERVDRGPRDTALRETFEEIGLGRERVEIAGYLDLYRTVTGFVVTPVVGLVRPGFALRLDPHEVAEAFEVPLDWLADRGNLQRQRRRFGDREVRFYAFQFEQYCIWGATAAMLVNLLERLRSDENKPINTMAWNPK